MRTLTLAVLFATLFVSAGHTQRVQLPRAREPLSLCDFARSETIALWTGVPHEGTTLEGRPAMRFTFPQYQEGGGEWPLVSLRYAGGQGYAANDWSHYGKIVCDVAVDGDEVEDIAIELRDTAGTNGYAMHIAVPPHKVSHLELPLDDVNAQIDVSHVEEIIFYTGRPPRTYTVTVADLRLLPGEPTSLATFDLVYPNYRDLILPDANRITVTAEAASQEYDLEPHDLTLEITCEAGQTKVSARAPFRRAIARVSVPTSSLPSGPARLTAGVIGPDGAPLLSKQWVLRKLTSAEVGRLRVYVDRDNNTVVDGKPFFPLGWYGNGSNAQANEIMDSPFNCLLDYGANAKPRRQMLSYLDMLQRGGVKLIYCLNDVYPSATYHADKGWEGIKGNEAIAEAVVQAYRDHPALLAWYLNDERPRAAAPEMTEYYQRIRALDLNHPAYIVLCDMGELHYFTDTTDVMGVDPYPIPQGSVTLVSDWTDRAVESVRGHKPVWMVPQAFAWYQHHPPGSDRARIPTEEELRTGRAPTYEESRCMTYLALAHGAKGLVYWCYYNMRMLPQYQEMWAGMKRIGAEVRALSPVLLSPHDLGKARFTPEDAPIHTRLIKHEGRLYLIAVNAGQEPCDVTFHLRHALPRQVTVMFEDRTAPGAGTDLAESFRPLEAHVYDLGPVAR